MRSAWTSLLAVVVAVAWMGVAGCQASSPSSEVPAASSSTKSIDESVTAPPPRVEAPAKTEEPKKDEAAKDETAKDQPKTETTTKEEPKKDEPKTAATAPATSETTKPATTEKAAETPAETPKEKPVQKNPVVEMKTSMGNITIELYPEKAPATVANFLKYVDEKFYDGTIFHRVIGNFMIQGGGFEPGLKQKATHDPVKNEAGNGLKNDRGTIAMARTNVVDSATAQFFINVVDNAMLNHRDETVRGFGYCVFGKVTAGLDVVDKIKAVATRTVGPFGDVPVKDVVIESVRRVEAK
jgi:cyclophilin family peptidyl-prolyl cis-trans isomerase